MPLNDDDGDDFHNHNCDCHCTGYNSFFRRYTTLACPHTPSTYYLVHSSFSRALHLYLNLRPVRLTCFITEHSPDHALEKRRINSSNLSLARHLLYPIRISSSQPASWRTPPNRKRASGSKNSSSLNRNLASTWRARRDTCATSSLRSLYVSLLHTYLF